MAKKNTENTVNAVTIVEARLTMWGTAENRARLLTQELVKLGELDLADDAKRLLNRCRAGFDAAYADVAVDNPARG